MCDFFRPGTGFSPYPAEYPLPSACELLVLADPCADQRQLPFFRNGLPFFLIVFYRTQTGAAIPFEVTPSLLKDMKLSPEEAFEQGVCNRSPDCQMELLSGGLLRTGSSDGLPGGAACLCQEELRSRLFNLQGPYYLFPLCADELLTGGAYLFRSRLEAKFFWHQLCRQLPAGTPPWSAQALFTSDGRQFREL